MEPELRQDTPGPAGREADAARAAWLAATEQVRAAAANTLRSVIARAAAL
jgi:hypothetical protein